MSTTTEKLFIYNRSEADGDWIHIVPKGELPNKAAGIVQVLDDKALHNILVNITREKFQKGDDWPGVYAGREHFIYNENKDSEALAWFKDFEQRDNGLWANASGLTDIGREAVKNKRYKYTSFVSDRGDMEHLGENRYRVNKIETVGFTNMANGKELLTPITNREGATNDTGIDHESGLPIPTNTKDKSPHEKMQDEIYSADPLTPEQRQKRSIANQEWFDLLGTTNHRIQKSSGNWMGFKWIWDHCKAEYPHIYEAAFGNIMDDGPAASEAEADAALQNVVSVSNRIGKLAGMDFRWGWRFVQEHLPQVFNRQFKRQSVVASRERVDEGNMAGVQKKAERLFSDMVKSEQTLYGISWPHAFQRVRNRQATLLDLATFAITPREAMLRDPDLRTKLFSHATSPENQTINEVDVRLNAQRLFDRLAKEEIKAGATRAAVTLRVQNKRPILCKLLNREITAEAAFVLEPGLRNELT
ncbi:MAG TPA: phage protease [Pseudomonadales bacterium]|nr:phage protease [Pseudomonadales bacterium]